MERNLLKKRINILTENSDGEMYMIEVDDYNDIVNDFRGERSFVPSNDAKIYFASLDGKPITPYAYKDFLTLAQHIREEWTFRDDYNKAGIKSQVEQAKDFIKENSGVAREIHTLIDKQHHREDILSKLEERGLTDIPDAEIDRLVDAFERALSKNDSYYDAFWASADYVIDEFIQEYKTKTSVTNEKVVPPSLDELVREYEHFIEVTKDIRTVEQAKAFEEKYHIPVEINGVSIQTFEENMMPGEPIEWIRYEYFGHLWYLYDRFDGEPQFDIYYGEYGDYLLAENVTIDNLKENYSNYLLDEIVTLAKNELNGNGSIGYTMPDGLHHIYIYEDFLYNKKVFVIEPNRVVDGAHEPFADDVYIGTWGDFDELCKGIKWCLEQFEDDKKISLEDKLADATSKSQESDIGKTSEFDIEKE